MLTGKNYVGYDLSAESNSIFESINPETEKKNNKFHNATEGEINKAVEKAKNAFLEYSAKTAEERAGFLDTIAEEILGLGEELISTYCQESGYPEGRANGERGRTVGQLKAFATYIRTENWKDSFEDKADPNRSPLPKPGILRTSIPIGPVAVFGASNFPLAFSTAGGDTASALAAGSPVVVKAHPSHPGTGELVASAIINAAKKTGMPEGVFSHLNGNTNEVGTLLVTHPGIKGVGFTGSLKAGRALYDLAAKREEPIPVFAEMGSVNPVVVSSSTLQKRGKEVAHQLAGSFNLGAGQFCTSPGIIFTVGSEGLSEFEKELVGSSSQINAQCMLNKGIKQAFEKGKKTVSCSPYITVLSESNEEEGNRVTGSIVKVSSKNFIENDKLQEEVFGPFTMLVTCDNIKELNKTIDNLKGQLTASLIAEKEEFKDLKTTIQLLQHKAGRIIFNAMPTGVEVSAAMTHGGPYPASTDSRFTSVGIPAIKRWLRPVSFQDFPQELLP
ncbi:aldehyde dehydrogenase (NADP(+)) [Gillisia sp. CAL575]|uniref:aldehyde dehydrogenase (NADP(+)) n=1 Tax=Gillisia sp. CAL575 TaxID=985255 RepID=UPI0003A8E98C|nr:aldehyde dehydrogenase (NADP(+)) [Gillisia sp. CAL575]